MQRKQKAPLGMKVIAIWNAFVGVLLLLLAFLGASLVGLLGTLILGDLSVYVSELASIGILFVLIGILGVAFIILAYGLWHLKGWAFDIMFGYFVLLALVALFRLNLFSLVFDGLLAAYFWWKHDYFRGSWILKQVGVARKAM